jgi:hypothetical protein
MPDSIEILQHRISNQIEASEERCIATKANMTQITELVAISRNMLAHSRALLSI